MKTKFIINLAAIIMLAIMAGCSSNNGNGTGPDPSGNDTFDGIISSGGQFEDVQNESDTLSVDSSVTIDAGSEGFFCTTRTVDATEAPSEFPLFDVNADIIYPGNLLQGATLDAATPSPIPVKRGPGTIVMVIDNGADSVSRTVDEVSLSKIFNKKNEIIRDNPGIIPARFSFTVEEVSSREKLALALDVNIKNLIGSISSALSFSSDKQYNRFLVKLDQSFFTIAYQLPTTKEEIFDPSVTPDDIKPYIYDGNPAAFISSVTFGRKFYLLVESTESKEVMKASLNASFNAAVTSGNLGGDVKYVSDLSSLNIKAYALGGEAGDALSAVTTNFEDLKDFLASGASIETGIPISYVVRSLARPDKIVKVKIATQYDVTDCVPLGESIDNPIFWYRADEVQTTGSSRMVTKWTNYFQDTQFDAIPNSTSYGGQQIMNAIGDKPAIKFGPTSSSNGAELTYPGLKFRNTDYTVWAVVKLGSIEINYPEYFMFGSGSSQFSNLQVGFRDDSKVTMSHRNYGLDCPVVNSLDEFNLYTFVFSKDEGMKIYVNGSSSPIAVDASKTGALDSYLDAQIGSMFGNPVYIAEIKAYGVAVPDIIRQAVDDDLLAKYGL